MHTAGIILAGGVGNRFGGDTPKQFLKLGDYYIVEYCIRAFVPQVDAVVLVAHPDWLDFIRENIPLDDKIKLVSGGQTRQLSVYNGLDALCSVSPEIVAIHDGARPFVSPDLLQRCLDSAARAGSGIAALKTSDTLVEAEDRRVVRFIDRTAVWNIQTPQAFRYWEILRAHEQAGEQGRTDYTDDSGIFSDAGHAVLLVEGDAQNIKITSREDLVLCRAFLDLP